MKGAGVLAFLATLVITPLVIWVLHRLQVVDVPSERSSHTRRTPRGGGTGVFLGAVAGLAVAGVFGLSETWSLKTLLACVSVFAVVGMVDDIRTLHPLPRLGTQVVTASVFVGPWAYHNLPIDSPSARLLLSIAAVVWVVGFLNAFNFMDGINGISAVHAAIAGFTFVVIGHVLHLRFLQVCGATIGGASLGFLPYNFPRARVFLGDVGSYFIGTWLAITALIAVISEVPPEAALAPFAIYLADTSWTLLRRIKERKNPFEAHHEHVYQQLIDLGWSHTRTTVRVASWSALCAGLGLLSIVDGPALRILGDALILLAIPAYLTLPARVARRTGTTSDAAPVLDGAPPQPAA